MIGKLFKDESGATVVEYSVILGLITIVVMVAITALGHSVSTLYANLATTISNTNTSGS